MSEWKIVWREIGWKHHNTIRDGWAIEDTYYEEADRKVYAWIENNYLAVCDLTDYYPSGCYNIPLSLIEELKNK